MGYLNKASPRFSKLAVKGGQRSLSLTLTCPWLFLSSLVWSIMAVEMQTLLAFFSNLDTDGLLLPGVWRRTGCDIS